MKIAEFSVKNSQFTFTVFLAALALGIGSLLNMPRAEDPAFAPAGYNIVVVYPGANPDEIEKKITDKVEEKLGALENIDRMKSFSLNGLMILTIEFEHGEDPDQKYEEVVREFNTLLPELPDEIYSTRIQRFSSSDVNILQAAIISENASWNQLRLEAERLEEMLERVPGVKGAETWGFPKREVRIDLNLAKMAASGVGVDRVLGALKSENLSIPGGALKVGEKQFFVQTSGDFESLEEIKKTIVNSTPGRIYYLEDMASVDFAYEERRHITRVNGVRCVFVTARMKDQENIFSVGDAVQGKIRQFEQGIPAHMDLVNVFDQSDSVRKRLTRFAKDFGIAILLVLITLLPLGLRAAFVVMISIPLSLALGVFAMDQLGYSLNQLSIVGFIIALGILVDDAIVVIENIERWLREGYSRKDAAILATKQIGMAVLGCTATLILAFLPLVFMPENSGDFIRSLPMAVVATVSASLVVSITIVPFLGSRILKEHEDPRGNLILRGMKWLISVSYARLLNWSLKHPFLAIAGSAAIFVGSLMLARTTGFTLFPTSERPMFYIDVETAPGAHLEATQRVIGQVDSVLSAYVADGFSIDQLGYRAQTAGITPQNLRYPGRGARARIVKYATNIGRGNPRIYYNVIREAEAANYGQIFVQLQENTPPKIKEALIDELRQKFRYVPGAVITVKNFEQGPPVEAPVVIRVFGENMDTLRHIAAKVENLISATEGTIYIDNPIATLQTDLKIQIHKEKAVTLGIPVAEIDRMIRLAVAGLNLGSFSSEADGETCDIVVGVPRTGQHPDLNVFKGLQINSLAGFSVPLEQVADIEFSPSPNLIEHYNKDRYATVSAFVQSGYFTKNINDQIRENLTQINLPSGYRFVVAGEEESAQRTFRGIGPVVIVTIFGLFAVLILEFGSFRSTLIVLSVIPLGIIGAIMALLATGYPFSFTVIVGLIALMGIEVKNSILLVDFTDQLREEGAGLDEAIQQAGEIRFVPILLTSMTAIGGLIPIAIEYNPLYSPLAWVLIGGLISSTLLSRIVTPVLYKLLAPKKDA